MEFIVIIGHVFNIVYTIALFFKDVLLLRTFLIIGGVLEMFYLFYATEDPLWEIIIWSGLWIGINAFFSIIIIRDRYGVKFDPETERIRNMVFDFMDKSEFRNLFKTVKMEVVPENTLLIKEGTRIDRLILISSGMANVEAKGKVVASLRDGNFMGEMSFITGNLTSANVTSTSELKYIYWEKETLLKLMEKNKDIKGAIHAVFNMDLLSKIQKD